MGERKKWAASAEMIHRRYLNTSGASVCCFSCPQTQ
jgi:hypothetical protein